MGSKFEFVDQPTTDVAAKLTLGSRLRMVSAGLGQLMLLLAAACLMSRAGNTARLLHSFVSFGTEDHEVLESLGDLDVYGTSAQGKVHYKGKVLGITGMGPPRVLKRN